MPWGSWQDRLPCLRTGSVALCSEGGSQAPRGRSHGAALPSRTTELTLFPAKRRGRGVLVSGKSLSRRGSRFSSMPWHEVTVSRSTRSLSSEWHSSSRW